MMQWLEKSLAEQDDLCLMPALSNCFSILKVKKKWGLADLKLFVQFEVMPSHLRRCSSLVKLTNSGLKVLKRFRVNLRHGLIDEGSKLPVSNDRPLFSRTWKLLAMKLNPASSRYVSLASEGFGGWTNIGSFPSMALSHRSRSSSDNAWNVYTNVGLKHRDTALVSDVWGQWSFGKHCCVKIREVVGSIPAEKKLL